MIRRTAQCPTNYTEYLMKQAEKAQLARVRRKFLSRRTTRVAWFRERFNALQPGSAVCLGARYGEEVEALNALGWTAHGIDLNEYPPWVQRGDMNAPLVGEYDLIYSNAFDHCWDPKSFLQNIHDALGLGGIAMLHLSDGQPGEYETIEWNWSD